MLALPDQPVPKRRDQFRRIAEALDMTVEELMAFSMLPRDRLAEIRELAERLGAIPVQDDEPQISPARSAGLQTMNSYRT
ncbi:hypothetical protein ME121_4499 [Methylobacterium sp. ME121]|jgi:hypothetical protein|nr:hypothetical protein AU375_00290 [Methylobacterium radiotolerans]GAN50453.1 hypothetical protein ME121_4499 [Methylobacterium sp. ME121]